jgi:hypothetical protein
MVHRNLDPLQNSPANRQMHGQDHPTVQCAENVRFQNIFQALVLSAAQNALLERKLQEQRDSVLSLQARLRVCRECLQTLHAQRPTSQADVEDNRISKAVSQLISGLNILDCLQDDFDKKEQLRCLETIELYRLRAQHARNQNNTGTILNHSEGLLKECSVHEKENISGQNKRPEQPELLVHENERLKSEAEHLQTRMDGLVSEVSAQNESLHKLRRELSELHTKLAQAQLKLKDKQTNGDKLLTLVRNIEANNHQLLKEAESKDEQILALSEVLCACKSKIKDKESVVLLLEQQCAAYELTLALQSQEYVSQTLSKSPHDSTRTVPESSRIKKLELADPRRRQILDRDNSRGRLCHKSQTGKTVNSRASSDFKCAHRTASGKQDQPELTHERQGTSRARSVKYRIVAF